MNSTRYPIVASLPMSCLASAQLGQDVISNDNCCDMPKPAQALSMAVTMQTLVSRSLEALQEAGDLAKRLNLNGWYAEYLQRHVKDIDAEALPEICALIERLEVEARR